MDELSRLCVRMMGEGAAARAAQAAQDAGNADDRLARIRAVLAACRDLLPAETGTTAGQDDGGRPAGLSAAGLSAAVAHEMATAVAGLSERQRALLALRDLLELSHAEIADVLDAERDEVVLGLAHARIALRDRLRGPGEAPAACPERDRALRTITLRLDREPVAAADEDWIIEHLGLCPSCGRLHATMLEARACYRAWPAGNADTPVAVAGGASA